MKNSVKMGVALALLGLAVVAFVLLRDRDAGEAAYYYDQSEQKLYTAPAAQIPPLAGIGGEANDGVVAVVYAFGEGRKAERQIAYLTTYSDDLARCMRQAEQARAGAAEYPEELGDRRWVNANTMVRRPDDPQWHALDSKEGQAALAILTTKGPDGTYPRICVPGG